MRILYESLQKGCNRHLILKSVILLTWASIKRVCELQAFLHSYPHCRVYATSFCPRIYDWDPQSCTTGCTVLRFLNSIPRWWRSDTAVLSANLEMVFKNLRACHHKPKCKHHPVSPSIRKCISKKTISFFPWQVVHFIFKSVSDRYCALFRLKAYGVDSIASSLLFRKNFVGRYLVYQSTFTM